MLLETAATTLTAAALAGATALAFKNQPAYRRLTSIAVPALLLIVVATIVWDLAVSRSGRAVFEFVADGKSRVASAALDRLRFSSTWATEALFAAAAYLKLAEFVVPWLLGEDAKRQIDDGKQDHEGDRRRYDK